MRKYILIPEYRPLYAMARCFGPTHGPLTKPTLTPVDVIGTLLKQTGKEKLSIYEVKMLEGGKTTPPVQLTQTNYMLPYEEIAENPQVPGQTFEEVKPPKPVAPTPPVKPQTPPPPTEEDNKQDTPLVEESAQQVEDEARLQGETVLVVKPEESVSGDADVTESETEDQPADALPVVHGDTGAATKEAAEEALDAEVSEVVNESKEEENDTADSAEDAPAEADKDDLPPAAPGEAVIQSGPYAGLTRAQKSAMKAAAKGHK